MVLAGDSREIVERGTEGFTFPRPGLPRNLSRMMDGELESNGLDQNLMGRG
jgi:hypothetical protein